MIKFPEHKCSLTITHNGHKDYYESVEEYLAKFVDLEMLSTDSDLRKCIDTDELWEIQWYPNTPISFELAIGSTLEKALSAANSHRQMENR